MSSNKQKLNNHIIRAKLAQPIIGGLGLGQKNISKCKPSKYFTYKTFTKPYFRNYIPHASYLYLKNSNMLVNLIMIYELYRLDWVRLT